MNTPLRIAHRQFLLSRISCDFPGWHHLPVAEYMLYTHPSLEVSKVHAGDRTLILLGYAFDFRDPVASNETILQQLLDTGSHEQMLTATAVLSGRFVLIYVSSGALSIAHDACGQREVFYDSAFGAFGSQPKLITRVIAGEPWPAGGSAAGFYSSKEFLQSTIYIGDTTHLANIRRLMPNHYADVRARAIRRYFPQAPRIGAALDAVVPKAIAMLQGYLRAAALRYSLDIGLTAGYDSRVLFLASDGVPGSVYVGRSAWKYNNTDIRIATALGIAAGRAVEVRAQQGEISDAARAIQDASIDFPRYRPLNEQVSTGKLIVNGNCSEIARSYFGDTTALTGKVLARMNGYGDVAFVVEQYQAWIDRNAMCFTQSGYHPLDMFYWEEKCGNVFAKNKSEANLSVEVYSPFCAHALLALLLSTDRKLRDKQFNTLYDTLIRTMSPAAAAIPINPVGKIRTIKWMKRLGIYNAYRKYGIRFGLLKG